MVKWQCLTLPFLLRVKMSAFKEQINRDLNAFINTDEFADFHNLNGTNLACIVSTSESMARTYSRNSSFDDNIFECDMVICYKQADFQQVFIARKSQVYLDNILYQVEHYSVDNGLVTLKLNRTA